MSNNDQTRISQSAYDKAMQAARLAIAQKGKHRSIGDRLFGLFGLRVASTKKQTAFVYGAGSKHDIERLKDVYDPRTGHLKSLPSKLSGELGTLFDAYLNDTHESMSQLRERNQRYESLDFMYLNEPFISQTADMLADEAAQIDQQDNLISIEAATQEQTKDMYRLLNLWNIDHEKTIDTLFNIGYYGDGLWGLKTMSDRGVTGVRPMHPRMLRERLEFNPIKQKERLLDLHNAWDQHKHRDAKIQALLDMVASDEVNDFSEVFETYLFGFDIAGEMVPPWAAYHFRLNPNRSEFYPYGKSSFVRALAPFKQMSSTQILQGMARVMSFPVREMQVKTADRMTEADQFLKINKVREMYDNQGYDFPDIASDPYSLLTTVWTSDGLMNLNIHESKVDIDSTTDLELQYDRVAIASGAPKGYLVQEWGGFGNSGVSLTEQHKPFARRVFSLQSAYLNGLSDIFRLHYAITGDFDYTQPFKLTMNFPNAEVESDRVSNKKDTLDLATSILDTIGDAMGVSGPLPFQVVKDVLLKVSAIRGDDLEKWMNLIRSSNPDLYIEDDLEGGEEGFDTADSEDVDDFFESDLHRYLSAASKLYEGEAKKKARRITERYLQVRENLILNIHMKFRMTEGMNGGSRHYLVTDHNKEGMSVMNTALEALANARVTTSARLRG